MIRKAVRLVVNADDLGLAESVNRGIMEAVEHGIVTSVSLMVNMPACDDAGRRLADAARRDVAPGVGLHLNVVTGRPLTPARTLMNGRGGEFAPVTTLAWRAWRGRIDPRDVEAELEAQLQRARAILLPIGLDVTHIDSHRHAHCLPGLFEVVTAAARRYGIGHVRHSIEAAGTQLGRPRAILAARLLQTLLAERDSFDGVQFTGVALMRSRSLESDLAMLLATLPDGTTELMVHPGYDSPELAALDGYRAPRERELRALMAPTLRDRLARMGVELVRFGATAPAEAAPTREIPAPL